MRGRCDNMMVHSRVGTPCCSGAARKPLCGYPQRGFESHPLRHTLLIFKALLGVSDSSLQMRMQGQRRHWVSCMKKPRTLLLTGARKSL